MVNTVKIPKYILQEFGEGSPALDLGAVCVVLKLWSAPHHTRIHTRGPSERPVGTVSQWSGLGMDFSSGSCLPVCVCLFVCLHDPL